MGVVVVVRLLWLIPGRLVSHTSLRYLIDSAANADDPELYPVLAKAYGANHNVDADPFYMGAARVPPGQLPANTAEEC